MYDEHSHPLLAQVPLTVSPFLSLPTATTLPYTYKSLSSTLPPSATDPPPNGAPDQKPAYVVSASGHAAHPDAIIASCHALQAHLRKLEDDARNTVKKWEGDIRERELAEKRRVAPGWLDTEERILVPERRAGDEGNREANAGSNPDGFRDPRSGDTRSDPLRDREGEELDRAFGGMELR